MEKTTSLLKYISDPARRAELAKATESSPDYLWQVATGWNGKRASHDLAMRIEDGTKGAVTCESLRDDVTWIRGPSGRVTGYQVRLQQRKAG